MATVGNLPFGLNDELFIDEKKLYVAELRDVRVRFESFGTSKMICDLYHVGDNFLSEFKSLLSNRHVQGKADVDQWLETHLACCHVMMLSPTYARSHLIYQCQDSREVSGNLKVLEFLWIKIFAILAILNNDSYVLTLKAKKDMVDNIHDATSNINIDVIDHYLDIKPASRQSTPKDAPEFLPKQVYNVLRKQTPMGYLEIKKEKTENLHNLIQAIEIWLDKKKIVVKAGHADEYTKVVEKAKDLLILLRKNHLVGYGIAKIYA